MPPGIWAGGNGIQKKENLLHAARRSAHRHTNKAQPILPAFTWAQPGRLYKRASQTHHRKQRRKKKLSKEFNSNRALRARLDLSRGWRSLISCVDSFSSCLANLQIHTSVDRSLPYAGRISGQVTNKTTHCAAGWLTAQQDKVVFSGSVALGGALRFFSPQRRRAR